jgi:phosphatidylserine/phosphatidylglycerophosphate/cardiolipin synthase-like enzyme
MSGKSKKSFGDEAGDIYPQLAHEINENFEVGRAYSVNELIKHFKKQGVSPSIIKDFVFYLIIKDFFKIEDYKKDIIQSQILFQKRIKLQIKPPMKKPPSPLVISIPPFNKFGFEAALKEQQIQYVKVRDKFVELIKNSKKEIKICSPFMELYKLKEIEDLIISRMDDGVKVKILTRELNGPKSSRYNQFKKFITRIKKLGLSDKIEVRDYHFSNKGVVLSSTHSKILVIDDKTAYLGSGEIRYNSFYKNFEVGIILNGPTLVKDLSGIYDTIFSKSKKLSW